MDPTRLRGTTGAALCLLLAGPAAAQQPAPELYHVHFVQAAAGKLPELIETYRKGPGPGPGDPDVEPLILRHREGGEWDLIVITPVGADYAATAEVPPPPVQGESTQPAAAGQPDLGLELRQHLAVHHDTVAAYVGGGEARR